MEDILDIYIPTVTMFQNFINKIKQHPINIKNYTAHPHNMVHVPAKFWEYTAMCVRVTVQKLNMTDSGRTGRGGGGGLSISPDPGLQRGGR